METFELTVDIAAEQLSDGEKIFVATFREVELASQGDTVENAMENAVEAFQLLMETASKSELERLLPLGRPRRTDV